MKTVIWIFNNVPLGPFAPYVFGIIMGRMPHKKQPPEDE